MEEYGQETMGGDPAGLEFDVMGKAVEEDGMVGTAHFSQSGTKIDYSKEPPIQFQKTATLVNYFITNTAQFLNTFSQVAETKLHEVDERLDEIEQILALYESKLDLPEEYFEDLPDMPAPVAIQAEVVARTENPLQDAFEPVAAKQATRAKTEKKVAAGKGGKGGAAAGAPEAKKTYVPPPPKDGAKIPVPAGMPTVKTFPISSGPPPNGMTFPGIEAAAPEEKKAGEEGQDAAPAEEEVDDGFTPEQRRKNVLEMDAGFKKYLMMYRMKIPLVNIRNKIINENPDGLYKQADIDLFAETVEIEIANNSLDKM